MKHYFIKCGLLVAVLVAGLLSGCQKEKEEFVTLGIRAEGVGGSGSKVIIGSGTNGNPQPQWEANATEEVKINADVKYVTGGSTSPSLAEVAAANTYRAVYPASIVTTTDLTISETVNVTLPETQKYKADGNDNQQVDIPMGAYLSVSDEQEGDPVLQFKNLCSLLKVTVTNNQGFDLVIKSLALESSNAGLCGAGTVTIDGFNDPYVTLINQSSKRVLLSMDDAGVQLANNTSKDFYFVVPVIAADKASQMTMSVTALNTEGTQIFNFTKSTVTTVTLARNTVAGAALSISDVTPETVSDLAAAGGRFAVGDNKFVSFASGNLIYTESTGLFSFDTSQYAYNTGYNGTNGVWEYFGWSTPSTYFGMNTLQSSDAYSGDFADWGGRVGDGSTWRTLSNSEWGYLFDTRDGAVINNGIEDGAVEGGHARYAQVKVCGKAGILLFPDQQSDGSNPFTWPVSVTRKPTTYNAYDANGTWNSIDYTYAEWHDLEDAGCVFLPAAGRRVGTAVSNDGSNGYYWSSTRGGTSRAYYLYFHGTSVSPQYHSNCYYGYSVRLVQDKN